MLELAAQGLRDTAITTALKTDYPDLTRHRVRVIVGEGAQPQNELAVFNLPSQQPPVYQGGPSIEEHADAWETVDRSLQNHFWYLGAIAASIDRSYGRGSIKELAEQVGKSPERIYQLLRTYKAFEGKDVSGQLTFTHYQYAADSDNPDYWIRRAHEEMMPTGKLLELIKGKQLPEFRLHPETPPETAPTLTKIAEGPLSPDMYDKLTQSVTEAGYGDFPLPEKPKLTQTITVDDEVIFEGPVFGERANAERSLSHWYSYIRSFNCLRCGASDVECAHIEAVLSTKTSGWLPRRTGLAEWACVPLCPSCHRTASDSIHAVGEDAFFDQLRSVKWAHDYLITRLLEFMTG